MVCYICDRRTNRTMRSSHALMQVVLLILFFIIQVLILLCHIWSSNANYFIVNIFINDYILPFINMALTGAPSLSLILIGNPINKYFPSFTFVKSSPSTIGTPFLKRIT